MNHLPAPGRQPPQTPLHAQHEPGHLQRRVFAGASGLCTARGPRLQNARGPRDLAVIRMPIASCQLNFADCSKTST